jgi:hypothetical protein
LLTASNATHSNASALTCQTCAPRLMYGDPKYSLGYFKVSRGNVVCTNNATVLDLKECAGSCDTTSKYTEVMSGFRSMCHCCAPQQTVARTVRLYCSDGTSLLKSYTVPETCSCGACPVTGR